jgi:hypothetical protein
VQRVTTGSAGRSVAAAIPAEAWAERMITMTQPYVRTTTSVRDGIWTEFDVDCADEAYSTLTASDTDHWPAVNRVLQPPAGTFD